jgi:Protein of unknown function (DUF3592)
MPELTLNGSGMQNSQLSPAVRFVFMRIFPWPFILAGGAVLFFGGRGMIRAHESLSWPTVLGVIRHSSVEVQSSSGSHGGTTYHADILYEYNVAGVPHSGNRVAYGDYGSSSPSHAQAIVNRYVVNRQVTVHYMPSDPDESLLEPGIQLQAVVIPAFGLIFFVSGVVMLVFLPGLFKRYT